MSDPDSNYIPEGWNPELQRFVRDDKDDLEVVACFVFESLPIHENEEADS